MLDLNQAEREWLDAFRRMLDGRFPGRVDTLVVYGSKARGDARPDSDLDVLVIVRDGDWSFKDALARAGHDLAIGTVVVPSIQVYTTREWHRLKERRSIFQEMVEREGVSSW